MKFCNKENILRNHLLKFPSTRSDYPAADEYVFSVVVFRSLVSGEDDELKAAYDHFHKMVQQEQGIVRNAILAGVEQLKLDVGVARTDVRGGLTMTQRIDRDTKTILADTAKIHRSMESKIVLWLYSLFGI